jgi:hypothetical protein
MSPARDAFDSPLYNAIANRYNVAIRIIGLPGGSPCPLLLPAIADLLAGAEVDMPPAHGTFKEARRVQEEGEQTELGM